MISLMSFVVYFCLLKLQYYLSEIFLFQLKMEIFQIRSHFRLKKEGKKQREKKRKRKREGKKERLSPFWYSSQAKVHILKNAQVQCGPIKSESLQVSEYSLSPSPSPSPSPSLPPFPPSLCPLLSVKINAFLLNFRNDLIQYFYIVGLVIIHSTFHSSFC